MLNYSKVFSFLSVVIIVIIVPFCPESHRFECFSRVSSWGRSGWEDITDIRWVWLFKFELSDMNRLILINRQFYIISTPSFYPRCPTINFVVISDMSSDKVEMFVNFTIPGLFAGFFEPNGEIISLIWSRSIGFLSDIEILWFEVVTGDRDDLTTFERTGSRKEIFDAWFTTSTLTIVRFASRTVKRDNTINMKLRYFCDKILT